MTVTGNWDSQRIPSRLWVVRRCALRGEVTAVIGPVAAMKSGLVLAWSCALALGMPHGFFEPDAAGTTLVYSVKDDWMEQGRRAFKQERAKGGRIMKIRPALAAAAVAAASVPALAHADTGMEAWCASETSAHGAVLCSSTALQTLATIRNQLFAKAWKTLSGDAYKALLADQKNWINTSAAQCGVTGTKFTLSYPIDPGIVQCFVRASLARNEYLREMLGMSSAPQPATASQPAAPPAPAATPAVAASTTQHPNDVLACHDHRGQLLQELHTAQAQLASVQGRTLPPPYYGGPAFAYRLLSFTQRKQAAEARLIARINAINAEGQQEANCIIAREREREAEKLEAAEQARRRMALEACETSLPCVDPGGNRIEKDAAISSQEDLAKTGGFTGIPLKDAFKEELRQIDAAVSIAKDHGYTCDSVSSWEPYLFSRGFKISCNHWSYTYDFADHGRGLEFSAE